MSKTTKPDFEVDKAKALKLLLCCLNENFTDKISNGLIIKKVAIEFDSQFNVKLPPQAELKIAREFASRDSRECCPDWEDGRIISWHICS